MAQPSQHEIKQELVDAIRMLEHAEYIDHNGHCSVRRDANSFYINSGASMRASLTVEDIVAVDLDGKPVDGDDVLHGQRGAHRGAGVDVERVGVAAQAAMTVVVDVLGMLKHADGIHQFLLDLALRRLCHDVSSCGP